MARNHLKVIAHFKESINAMYWYAEHMCYSQERFLLHRKEHILGTQQYQKLPQWAKEYLRGYEDCKHDAFYQNVLVFCYPNYEGKMLPVNGEEYEQFRKTYGYHDETINGNGHHCYVKDTSKVYA